MDPDGRTTTVTVRTGLAEVYGEGRAFIIDQRQTFRFFDHSLRDYQSFALLAPDEFERWSLERDRRWDASPSRRYVPADLIGYQDLDQYGTWRRVRDYGNVWVPNRVSADWAPYRDGHWAWVEPWGWTWIDDAPWGFAPSHYGRWARIDTGWAWVPGPATARPVYAPALVAFVGSANVSTGNGAVAWFPLGPRDVYRPSYSVSREYFTRVNTSNTTVVNRSNVANWYNATPANVTYTNQAIPGAIIAVLAAAFTQSRPVARETVKVTDVIARTQPRAAPPVAPVHLSVLGAPAAAAPKPPEEVQKRHAVAQVAPPPPPVSFAVKQDALAANAGKPLDTKALDALKPASAAAPAPAVTVVEAQKPVAAPARPASGPAATASAPAATGAAAAASAAAPAAPTAAAAQHPRRRLLPGAPRRERPDRASVRRPPRQVRPQRRPAGASGSPRSHAGPDPGTHTRTRRQRLRRRRPRAHPLLLPHATNGSARANPATRRDRTRAPPRPLGAASPHPSRRVQPRRHGQLRPRLPPPLHRRLRRPRPPHPQPRLPRHPRRHPRRRLHPDPATAPAPRTAGCTAFRATRAAGSARCAARKRDTTGAGRSRAARQRARTGRAGTCGERREAPGAKREAASARREAASERRRGASDQRPDEQGRKP